MAGERDLEVLLEVAVERGAHRRAAPERRWQPLLDHLHEVRRAKRHRRPRELDRHAVRERTVLGRQIAVLLHQREDVAAAGEHARAVAERIVERGAAPLGGLRDRRADHREPRVERLEARRERVRQHQVIGVAGELGRQLDVHDVADAE